MQASMLSLTMRIFHLRTWQKIWENIPEADWVTYCVWGEKKLSLPEKGARHSGAMVQQRQKRFLGKEWSHHCVCYRGQRSKGGAAGIQAIPEVECGTHGKYYIHQSLFFLLLFLSPGRLLSHLPSPGGAAGRGHRAPAGCASRRGQGCAAPPGVPCLTGVTQRPLVFAQEQTNREFLMPVYLQSGLSVRAQVRNALKLADA